MLAACIGSTAVAAVPAAKRYMIIINIVCRGVLGLYSKATSIIASYSSTLPKRQHIKGFKNITRSVDSVVSGIPSAEAGGWPSSTRLVGKIKPNEDG